MIFLDCYHSTAYNVCVSNPLLLYRPRYFSDPIHNWCSYWPHELEHELNWLWGLLILFVVTDPDSKVRGVNMGPIWGRQDPGGPHVGPMNFAILGLASWARQAEVSCHRDIIFNWTFCLVKYDICLSWIVYVSHWYYMMILFIQAVHLLTYCLVKFLFLLIHIVFLADMAEYQP